MKKLIRCIAKNKTKKDDAINSLRKDSDFIEERKNLKITSNRSTIISTYTDFVKIFGPNYFDKTDNKKDDKANN